MSDREPDAQVMVTIPGRNRDGTCNIECPLNRFVNDNYDRACSELYHVDCGFWRTKPGPSCPLNNRPKGGGLLIGVLTKVTEFGGCHDDCQLCDVLTGECTRRLSVYDEEMGLMTPGPGCPQYKGAPNDEM